MEDSNASGAKSGRRAIKYIQNHTYLLPYCVAFHWYLFVAITGKNLRIPTALYVLDGYNSSTDPVCSGEVESADVVKFWLQTISGKKSCKVSNLSHIVLKPAQKDIVSCAIYVVGAIDYILEKDGDVEWANCLDLGHNFLKNSIELIRAAFEHLFLSSEEGNNDEAADMNEFDEDAPSSNSNSAAVGGKRKVEEKQLQNKRSRIDAPAAAVIRSSRSKSVPIPSPCK